MDNEDFYTNRQQIFVRSHKILNPQPNSTTINPWTEHELANPYLNFNNITKSKSELRKLNSRKKVMSVDQLKNNKLLFNFASKELTQPNKIPRELPKLNIDKLMRDETYRKRKTVNGPSQKHLLNASPMYFSSPTMKRTNQLNYSSENIKKLNVFPSVSRELNITRKIYLLENKLNSNTLTLSPVKKSPRYEYKKQQGSDIRRLVEKEWSKKL